MNGFPSGNKCHSQLFSFGGVAVASAVQCSAVQFDHESCSLLSHKYFTLLADALWFVFVPLVLTVALGGTSKAPWQR